MGHRHTIHNKTQYSRVDLKNQSLNDHMKFGDSPSELCARGQRVATNIHRQIAGELGVREQQVEAAVALLDGGATVPFRAKFLVSNL